MYAWTAHLLTLIDGQYLGFSLCFPSCCWKEDPLTIQHLNALLDVIYFPHGVIYTPLKLGGISSLHFK